MPKDAGQMQTGLEAASAIGGARARSDSRQRRLGSSLAGDPANQGLEAPGPNNTGGSGIPSQSSTGLEMGRPVKSRYLSASPSGDVTSVERGLSNQNRMAQTPVGQNQYQNQDAQNQMYQMQNQMNPYGMMGNWMAQPNAMDRMGQNYGNMGGYMPAWAQQGSQTMMGQLKQPEKPVAPTPAATQTPATSAGGGVNSNDANNQITAKVGRALNPDELKELGGAIGYSGQGDLTQQQLQQAMTLIDQNRARLGMGGM